MFSAYDDRSSAAIAAIAFVHASIFLFPAMIIALPTPSPRRFETDVIVGFSFIVNTWVALSFVLLQFYPQFLEWRRMAGQPGSLSLLSLGLQAAVLLAAAVRWLLRLGVPTWGNQPALLSMRYQWGALPFNYILHGVGYAILLAAYLIAGRGSDGRHEEAPLLA